jgi:hypothetical protein
LVHAKRLGFVTFARYNIALPMSDLGKEVVMNDIRGWLAAHLPA